MDKLLFKGIISSTENKVFKYGVTSDIYIGQDAGRIILNDIKSCQSSLYIISPCLGSNYLYELFKLTERGVDVRLITSDNFLYEKGGKGKTIAQNLVSANRLADREAIAYRKKALTLMRVFGVLIIFPGIISIVLILYYRNKRKKALEYNYEYDFLFPVEIKNPYSFENGGFHHKAYITDGRVAYSGPLNFSHGRFNANIESRIKIIDKEFIRSLIYHFFQLYKQNSFHSSFSAANVGRFAYSGYGQNTYWKNKVLIHI